MDQEVILRNYGLISNVKIASMLGVKAYIVNNFIHRHRDEVEYQHKARNKGTLSELKKYIRAHMDQNTNQIATAVGFPYMTVKKYRSKWHMNSWEEYKASLPTIDTNGKIRLQGQNDLPIANTKRNRPEKRRWTADEDNYLKANWKCMAVSTLSVKLDRSIPAVIQRMYYMRNHLI